MLQKILKVPIQLGETIIDNLRGFGAAWLFLFQIIWRAFLPPWHFSLLLKQIYQIGVGSIAVVTLVGGFTGAVLAVQGEHTLSKFGATAFTSPMIALGLLRELGPVLTALMVNGRAGSAMTAELGIMKITEQVDALRSMAVDPIQHLMVPRLLAGIICLPILSLFFNCMGIFGGYLVGVGTLDLASGTFISQMTSAVAPVDVYSGIVKALVFGLCFAWISCYKGWTCGFGAVGVNAATTSAVVTSSVTILVVDYFLTSILTQVLF